MLQKVLLKKPKTSSAMVHLVIHQGSHDVGTILDQMGVAVRAGQHCAQPVMDRFGVHATARASFGMYNTKAEAEALATAVAKTIEIFG